MPVSSELQEAELKDLPSDDEIILLRQQWFLDCEDYHDELKKVADKSREYATGNQTNLGMLEGYESHAVENRLFLADETAVPIATERLPENEVLPPTYDEESVDLANKLGKVVKYLMRESDVQHKSEISYRSIARNRFFVWHPYWNEEKQQIDFRIVPSKNCYFPRYAFGNLPYFMERQQYNIYDLVEIFGKGAVDKVSKDRDDSMLGQDKHDAKGKYFVWAIWTRKWVAWVGSKGVLEKMKNPTWNWDEPERNHYPRPRIPYIIGTAFEDGEETVGITSLYEQDYSPQDTVNTVYRFMEDYMNTVGDPKWRIDSKVMSREEADQITSEPGTKLYGNGAANENMVRRDTPPPMPSYIPNLLQIAQQQTDNIYGTHSTTRGEQGSQKTLGEAELLKEADYGRLDMFTRILGRSIGELGNWYIQLMTIYYDEKRDIPVLDATEELTFIEDFSREMIQKGVKFQIKLGRALPDDKEARANLYLQLSKANLIRPLDLYKALELPNPQELEDNLIKWQSGALQQQAMMQVQQGMVPGQAPPVGPPVAPGQPPIPGQVPV